MYSRILLYIFLYAAFPSLSFSQPADKRTGVWMGIAEGTRLPLYFRVRGDSANGFSADWNSPAELAMGMVCKSVHIWSDSLTIETAGIAASYKGQYLPGLDSVTGTWKQNGQTFSLNLWRLRRPQTPVPPYPYRSDSVEYDNSEGTVHLGATLTRPFDNGGSSARKKYPVVILITGSGQQDRDETLFEHRPFAIIADYLTRRGMAVLRVDDRGKGISKGNVSKATSSDFADDVLAGIHYLIGRKDIDSTRIGLIGHSEGGLIAPIVYTRWSHIRFIICLAGTGVPGRAISLRQQTDPVRKLGQNVYDAYYPLVSEKMKIIEEHYGQPDSITLSYIKAGYRQWKAALPDSIALALRTKNVSDVMYGFQVSAELIPWLRYFYHTDPALFLAQVKCPVLALNGGKDHQVDAGQNLPAIKAALSNGNQKDVTYVFPGLNHLFQHAPTGEVSEYAVLEESFAPEVLQMMGDWIGKIDKLYP